MHSLKSCIRIAAWLIATAATSPADTPGLDNPEAVGAFFNGTFPATPPGDPSGWAVENAFPNLTFTDPMMLAEIPGTTDLLVAGKTGLIWRIPNDPEAVMTQRIEVLDWTAKTQIAEDQGFYSVVFHPNFGQSGQTGENHLFVCYSGAAIPGVDDPETRSYWTVSRFDWLPASGTIDPSSEYVLISQYDPHQFHNGGATYFDNDGYLCISVGDGGDGADRFGNSQRIDLGFFGGILRIDVDYFPGKPGSHAILRQPTEDPNWHLNPRPVDWPVSYSQGYGIPDDNPWLDPEGGLLEEFYAIGLRSPHSAHYDPLTGETWVGDVGQNAREELTKLVKGSNCQWSYMEGFNSTSKSDPDTLVDIETPPVHDYDHTVGASIIGGMRYRGAKWDAFLGGKVIFGDHVRGRIWNLEMPESGNGPPTVSEMYSSFDTGYKAGLCNFCTDSAGEIYIMNLSGPSQSDGTIMKLAVPAISAEPPQFLSQTGVFSDLSTLTTAPGVIPYKISNPLWSDNAEKRRWIILPNDGSFDTPEEKIVFSEKESWQFPPGTVFVKHFEVPIDASNPGSLKRLETRFLVCIADGDKYGFTYKWNAEGTDAELLATGTEESYDFDTGSGIETRSWTFPSRGDCMICHNDSSGQALGVRSFHMNSDAFYPSTGRTANQLQTLNSLGAFDVSLSVSQLEDFLEARALDDETAPLEHRIRSYLDTNCSHCHQPGAQGAGFDARLSTPLDVQNLINGIPDRYEELGAEGRYIKPGDTSLSAALVRLSAVGNGDAMPPLAKNLAHGQGVAQLQAYIEDLVPAEFETPPAPKGRYLKLTSLSGRRSYAAVAELTILDGEGEPIPFGELSIADFDSEAGTSTPATEAIDGITDSTANFWQTVNDGESDHPHHITVDLGSEREIGGYIYVPRQGTSSSSANGRIYDYVIEYSSDNSTWTTFDSGTWDNTPDPHTFAPGYNKRAARCQIAGPVTANGQFDVTIVFDMDTDEFTESDLIVSGGNVAHLRGSGYYYVASINPTDENVSVQVQEDAASPEGKGSLASSTLIIAVEGADNTPPSTPGNFAASPTATTITLSWDASVDVGGIEAYEILRDDVVIATTSDLSYVDTFLAPNSSFDYSITAIDPTGNRSLSATVSTSTLPDTVAPSSPTNLAAAVADFESIQLTWDASSDDVGVTEYRIERDGEPLATVVTAGFTDSGLRRDTSYSYSVVAADAADNASEAATLTAETLGYHDWLESFNLEGEESSDSDQGGLDNMSEYFLNLDPSDSLDDLSFKLTFSIDASGVHISLPNLVPSGDFHLHASDSLEDINDLSKRALTITSAEIEAMAPEVRTNYTTDLPVGSRGFFMLIFEPEAP